ncbi:hypothetical protein L6452_28022 [Arctium lappa]|uniref:Uncharacterized protein n=1 Tax=Arctium lappa TaxID=4217 RepID=A0ACB8ZX63_ARCLA|nr:hypothetical protein L6452_28022 [Arctium lappa]
MVGRYNDDEEDETLVKESSNHLSNLKGWLAALYSDISPWCIAKPWEDLQPFEWDQVRSVYVEQAISDLLDFSHHVIVLRSASDLQFWHKGWKTNQCSCSDAHLHSATGSANYSKQRSTFLDRDQPLMKAAVSLDDVTIYYAHFRPFVPVKSELRSWWKYAYRVVSDQTKKASFHPTDRSLSLEMKA